MTIEVTADDITWKVEEQGNVFLESGSYDLGGDKEEFLNKAVKNIPSDIKISEEDNRTLQSEVKNDLEFLLRLVQMQASNLAKTYFEGVLRNMISSAISSENIEELKTLSKEVESLKGEIEARTDGQQEKHVINRIAKEPLSFDEDSSEVKAVNKVGIIKILSQLLSQGLDLQNLVQHLEQITDENFDQIFQDRSIAKKELIGEIKKCNSEDLKDIIDNVIKKMTTSTSPKGARAEEQEQKIPQPQQQK